MQRCLNVIDSQAHDALQSDNISGVDYQTLELILGRDNLRADETVVFTAAVGWAKAECTRQGRDTSSQQCRDVLGDALYLIRFPIMTPSDFANGARQSGLLSQQEIIDILLDFTTKQNDPNLRFSTSYRKPRTLMCCRRYPKVVFGWVPNAPCESLQFSVDKPIFVAGFGLYGSHDKEYSIDLMLKHNGVVLRQKGCDIAHLNDDSKTKTVPVLFDKPLRIAPNTRYTVTLVMMPTPPENLIFVMPSAPGGFHYYTGVSGPSLITHGDLNFSFTNSDIDGNRTTVEKGQIPEILFYF